MKEIAFHDNILVQRRRRGNEYLSIAFKEYEDVYLPYEVSITRYCVPGRIDSYCFDYSPSRNSGCGSRVRYFSDAGLSLPEAIKVLHEDLTKRQVIELIVTACSQPKLRYYSKQFTANLLTALAPKSKALKLAIRAIPSLQQKQEPK